MNVHIHLLTVLAIAQRKQTSSAQPIDRLLGQQGLPISEEPNATVGMSNAEGVNLIKALLRPATRTYIEWGSGGSTELVSWLVLSGRMRPDFRAVSVESSSEWMAYMRGRSTLIRRAEQTGQMKYVHGSMGQTGHLGYPKGFISSDHKRSLAYVGLDGKLGGRKADVALVDGRFRLACMLEAFRHLRRPHNVHSDAVSPIVLLHDYAVIPPGLHQRRFDEYSRALQFYDLKWMNDTLATLMPKPSVSPTAVAAALERALGRPDR